MFISKSEYVKTRIQHVWHIPDVIEVYNWKEITMKTIQDNPDSQWIGLFHWYIFVYLFALEKHA